MTEEDERSDIDVEKNQAEEAEMEALEQYKAEQEFMREYNEQLQEDRHPWNCFCTRCDG